MATYYDEITSEQTQLIKDARVFFVATADPNLAAGPHGAGPVNLSPKGGVPLHVLDAKRVAYLDYAGSGNETARHVTAGSPITLMVCSFDDDAAIVRLYGHATVSPLEGSPLAAMLLAAAPAESERPLTVRQIFDITVERTVTSCGYAVPIMEFATDRTKTLRGRRYK